MTVAPVPNRAAGHPAVAAGEDRPPSDAGTGPCEGPANPSAVTP